ncbi:hypothetical protein H4S01_004037 [Coemansia sp. RSA 2610]|nr:hypothetical protein H4S01_004037 [Coemansia sp. RSA 2610]
MDDHLSLVDVLLLPDCSLYQRYPELVQRVDYFLHNWCEDMLARTEALLRRQSRGLRNSAVGRERSDDAAFTHTRSLNIVWRQWAVSRLQLPQYPPERINWNKDADPVFLYGQVPALRPGVPWSAHSPDAQPAARSAQLKPALKRTDLQTFLTSPTLSPAPSPPHSPAMSIRESMSTSSFGSDATLENDEALRPRLRFNDRVEQCMVVFDQEKEYLPTDDEGNASDAGSARRLVTAKHTHRRTASASARARSRRSLVIRLAPAHLKGDHRKIAVAAADPARYDSDEDPFGDYDDSFAMFGDPPASRHASPAASGVSGYVQGYVQSVAGQVRRLVGDSVLAAPFAKERAAEIVSDPYASRQRQSCAGATHPGASPARGPADVVRDPYSSAAAQGLPADHVPFDDDEDAIIQAFEREMLKCSGPQSPAYTSFASRHAAPAASEWGLDDDDDYDMYESEFQLHMDHSDSGCYADYKDSRIAREPPAYSACRAGSQAISLVRERTPLAQNAAAAAVGAARPPIVRNESIIDRAEDTLVNTVDAVKWCASFISNYTIF